MRRTGLLAAVRVLGMVVVAGREERGIWLEVMKIEWVSAS